MKEIVTDPLCFFLSSIVLGIILFALYDMIRAIRRVFKHQGIFVILEDIGYAIMVALISFQFLYTYNYGELRGFYFLGIVFGMIIYYKILSQKLLTIMIRIFSKIQEMNTKIFTIALKPGIHIKRNIKWQLKKEKKQVTMALKKNTKRGGKDGN